MKKFRILCLFVCILVMFGLSVHAVSPLSPAMGIIGHNLEVVKTGIGENSVSFTEEDFTSVFGPMEGIEVTSLPKTKDGILKCGSVPVKVGDVFSMDRVSAIRFIPTSKCETVHFYVKPAGLGYTEDFICTVHMLEALNFAPTVKNEFLQGKIGIPVFGSVKAVDPEGDSMTYHLEKMPSCGSLQFTPDGHYRYTAAENSKKTDSFTYRVSDIYGNLSKVATVTLLNEENKSGIVYADMDYDDSAYAASMLAEMGILVGDTVGEKTCFHPEEKVSRGDFLVMAMQLAEIDPSFFVGDESPYRDAGNFHFYSPYILAGTRLGIVKGKETADGRMFDMDAPITSGEAATVIGRIAKVKGLPVGEAVSVALTDEGITDDGIDTLYAAGFSVTDDSDLPVTRAECAKLLYRLYESCNEKTNV